MHAKRESGLVSFKHTSFDGTGRQAFEPNKILNLKMTTRAKARGYRGVLHSRSRGL
jgi:hypothetical protein